MPRRRIPTSFRPIGQGTTTSFVLPADITSWQELIPRTGTRLAWRRFAVPAAILFAVVLSLPSLGIGFFLDDYVMLSLIEGRYDFPTPTFNLYGSFLEAADLWWTSPSAELTFWRPLSSALIRLNYFLFGHDAFLYHLELLLGLAALVAVCGRLYRGLSPVIAGIALLIFAADESHAFTSGLVCHSHTLVSVLPALFGLEAYLRFRESAWRPGIWLSLLGFSVGLLAGETAFAVMAYPLAYELFAAAGPVRMRLRSITPLVLLATAYLIFYKVMGYGPGETGVYLNPFAQSPTEFLGGLAAYLPLYVASLVAAIPIDFAMSPSLRLLYLVTGVAAPVALLWGWQKVQGQLARPNRKALNWWVPGAFGSLLPVALAFPDERQLLVPAIGLAPLLASFILVAWHSCRRPLSSRRIRYGALAVLTLLATLHFGVASWNRVKTLLTVAQNAEKLEATAAKVTSLASTASTPTGRLSAPYEVVLLGSDFETSVFGPAVSSFRSGRVSWTTLTMSPFEHRLTRTAPETLVVEFVDARMLATIPERLFRLPDDDLVPGDKLEARLFTAEILDVDDVGPTRVAFHFHRDLDDSSLSLVAFQEGRPVKLDPPPVGESILFVPRGSAALLRESPNS